MTFNIYKPLSYPKTGTFFSLLYCFNLFSKYFSLISRICNSFKLHMYMSFTFKFSMPFTCVCTSPPTLSFFSYPFPSICLIILKLWTLELLTLTPHWQVLFSPYNASHKFHTQLNQILPSENGGFPAQSERVGWDNPSYFFRGVHPLVTKFSYLLCDSVSEGECSHLLRNNLSSVKHFKKTCSQ